jgi:SAM-dependent methyltransferase
MADDVATSDETQWERVERTTRWGRYLADRERNGLDRAHVHVSPPGDALDIGCDAGRWSRVLHQRGWSLTCVDINADALEVCRRRIPGAQIVHVSPDARTLPTSDESVDLLLAYEVPEVSGADWFPSEAARVIRTGGALVMTYANPHSPRGGANAILSRLQRHPEAPGARQRNFYSGPGYRALRRRLRALGFRIAFEEGLCWFPFGRSSSSRLIPLATTLEARLGLRRLPTISGWVICVALRDRQD